MTADATAHGGTLEDFTLMDGLDFVVDWFSTQCDGDWEHDVGIRIATLDNPGWSVDIRTDATVLAGIETEWSVSEESENSWLYWRATGHMFEARCGPGDLRRALDVFRRFVFDHAL